MSSILNLIEIEVAPVIAEAKALVGKAETFLVNELKSIPLRAIAFIKETSFGTALINVISAAEASGESGETKFAAVIAATEKAYDAFVANGGLSGLIAAGMNILRALVEVFVADFKTAFE